MLNLLEITAINVGRSLFQIITGRLFTDAQIFAISSHAVGRFFADWLPEPRGEHDTKEKVDKAQNHIAEASRLVSDLKAELDQQARSLEALSEEVE